MVFGPQALCLTTQIDCYFFWYSSSSNCRHNIPLLKHCCYWGSSSAEHWLQWICSSTWITAHLTSTDEAVQVWKKKKKKDMIIRQIQSLIPPPLFSTAFSLSPLWAVEENDSPRVNNKEVYGMWRMWSYSTWNSNEGVTAAWLMLHPNINSHLVLLPSLCRRTHSWRETVGKKKERKKKIAANSTSACQSGTHIGTSDGEKGAEHWQGLRRRRVSERWCHLLWVNYVSD